MEFGKFSKEAEQASADLLRRMVRLHYAWKYTFLRPENKMVVDRYNKKHHTSLHAMLARQAAQAEASSSTEAAEATIYEADGFTANMAEAAAAAAADAEVATS